ncbi:MAG TPA: hypothetical protein VI078_08135 [bacterium]
MRRIGPLLAAAALAVALGAGCDRPPDEAWLRFLGFDRSAAVDTVSPLTVIEGSLASGVEKANAGFVNTSFTVGGDNTTAGTGIFVYSAHVEYGLAGSALPSYDYPVTLYLAAPKAGETTTGKIFDFPVVPAALKEWIAANVPGSVISLTARVTFHAQTDEGTRLETDGGIQIVLTR